MFLVFSENREATALNNLNLQQTIRQYTFKKLLILVKPIGICRNPTDELSAIFVNSENWSRVLWENAGLAKDDLYSKIETLQSMRKSANESGSEKYIPSQIKYSINK